MPKPAEIHGRHCQLLPLQPHDVELATELFGDREVTRYSRVDVLDRDACAVLLAQWLEVMDDCYWKVNSPGGEPLGIVFLRKLSRDHHAAEIGYTFLPAAWGKGIASDAVGATLRFGFGSLRLVRIEAYVSTGNLASLRVLEKHGFQREGLRRSDCLKHGEWQDAFLLSCIDEHNRAAWSGKDSA